MKIFSPHNSFAGFDAVTVANNHFNDFGSEGANFTIEVLTKAGIKYFGITYGEYDSSQVWYSNLSFLFLFRLFLLFNRSFL